MDFKGFQGTFGIIVENNRPMFGNFAEIGPVARKIIISRVIMNPLLYDHLKYRMMHFLWVITLTANTINCSLPDF